MRPPDRPIVLGRGAGILSRYRASHLGVIRSGSRYSRGAATRSSLLTATLRGGPWVTTAERKLSAKDFAVAQVQATIFTPDEEVSAAKLAKGLLPKWAQRFDGEPFVLPSPLGGIPRELPKVVLHNKAGDWRCEIASERASVFWRALGSGETGVSLASFYKEAVRLLREYKEFLSARVGRMAAVTTRFADHPNPGLFLTHHFCQERWFKAPLNRPENLELHAHKKFLLGGRYTVNSWVRNKTGVLTLGEKQVSIVFVEQDINTLAEEATARDFTHEDVAGFFAAAAGEFDVILGLYYPDGEYK
jgi:hypothetical protein